MSYKKILFVLVLLSSMSIVFPEGARAQTMCFGVDSTAMSAKGAYILIDAKTKGADSAALELTSCWKYSPFISFINAEGLSTLPENELAYYIVPQCTFLKDSTANYSLALYQLEKPFSLEKTEMHEGFFVVNDNRKPLVNLPILKIHLRDGHMVFLIRALASLLETSFVHSEKDWKHKFPLKYAHEYLERLYIDTVDLSPAFRKDETILRSIATHARIVQWTDSIQLDIRKKGSALAYNVPVWEEGGNHMIHRYFMFVDTGIFYYEVIPMSTHPERQFSKPDMARYGLEFLPGKARGPRS